MVENHPTCAKDQARLHKYGTKVLSSIFVGHALVAEENLERSLSEIHARRFNAKEVLMPENGTGSYSFSQMDQSSWQEGIRFFETPPLFRIILQQERSTTMFLETSRACLNHRTSIAMTLKREMMSGVFLDTIQIVITLN